MPDYTLEKKYSNFFVVGIDEVGRGSLAGPVMACAVFIPEGLRKNAIFKDVDDSKKISTIQRMKIVEILKPLCVSGIGAASAQEIDQYNILRATMLAMERAYCNLQRTLEKLNYGATANKVFALIDGNQKPSLDCAMQTVVKGDQKSISIACASLIAKVMRDNIMQDLGQRYLAYGWNKNAGYGTKLHREMIIEHGITPYHRKSFAPIRNIVSSTLRI